MSPVHPAMAASLWVGSINLKDVILIQLEGWRSSRTSSSVNVIRGSIAHQSSSTHSASWQGLPGVSGWTFSAQCWEGLCIDQGLLRLCQVEVLASKSYILEGRNWSLSRSSVPVVQSSCYLPLMHDISPWVLKRMPTPSW